jgi:phosphate starvation-inducible membrane PsiE
MTTETTVQSAAANRAQELDHSSLVLTLLVATAIVLMNLGTFMASRSEARHQSVAQTP